MPQKSIEDEIRELQLEKAKLELEETRERILEFKRKRETRQATHAEVENSLAETRKNEKAFQDNCTHRQGGVDLAGIRGQGNDAKYAVIKHRMPLGDIHVMCLRCNKWWTPSAPDYREALNFHTNTTLSESSQFRVQTN